MNRILLATTTAASLILSACGSETSSAPSGASAAKDPVACAQGNTIAGGTLTIATGEPAFPPYVLNDATPQDGQGFEAAIGMAVAKQDRKSVV